MLALLIWLIVKHFVVDFLLQGPYQYKNKGTYGHPGGILHAGLHSIATWLILIYVITVPEILAILTAILEGVLHYHIDFIKININKKMNWLPNNSEYFWWLLGLDQLLHYMCYVGILWIVFNP